MADLFDSEQQIFDNAGKYLNDVRNGASYNINEFAGLLTEYGKLLKQLRRITKISDKTTNELNISKLDLLGKAYYDALTGIYNRRFLDENLDRVINTMSRMGGVLSILMIDIDLFKSYNDQYGHDAGDRCLRTVATTLRRSVTRADDFVARYGGEEFVAVLPNTDERGACVISRRILKNVRGSSVCNDGKDGKVYVTVSIGATTGEAIYMKSSSDFIKRADEALYVSKCSGRNRYTFMSLEEE